MLFLLHIVLNGIFVGNIDATVTMQGERITKDAETYFHIKDFYVDFVLGHASIELKNLFNGDKKLGNKYFVVYVFTLYKQKFLGEAMNLFLNDNWKNVVSEIKPALEDTMAAIFKKFANKIFHKYPINVILPQ